MLPAWMSMTVIILAVLLVVAYLAWLFFIILEVIFSAVSFITFSKDFKASVQHTQPTWEELQEAAPTRDLTQSQIYRIIKRCYRKVLAGRQNDLLEHKELIKSYIDPYKKDKIFEDLPNKVRIELKHLRDQMTQNEHSLNPLTWQIKELVETKNKENRCQKFFMMGGFFIGSVGVGFTVYTYFTTHQLPKSDNNVKTEQHQSALTWGQIKPTPNSDTLVRQQ